MLSLQVRTRLFYPEYLTWGPELDKGWARVCSVNMRAYCYQMQARLQKNALAPEESNSSEAVGIDLKTLGEWLVPYL